MQRYLFDDPSQMLEGSSFILSFNPYWMATIPVISNSFLKWHRTLVWVDYGDSKGRLGYDKEAQSSETNAVMNDFTKCQWRIW